MYYVFLDARTNKIEILENVLGNKSYRNVFDKTQLKQIVISLNYMSHQTASLEPSFSYYGNSCNGYWNPKMEIEPIIRIILHQNK